MFRSTALRLAALYTAAFAASVVGLGTITLVTTRASLRQQFDARIQAESAALAQEFRTEGLKGVLQAVRERDRTPGALDYGLETAEGGRSPAAWRGGARGWAGPACPCRSAPARGSRSGS